MLVRLFAAPQDFQAENCKKAETALRRKAFFTAGMRKIHSFQRIRLTIVDKYISVYIKAVSG